jgi:hypothetical protein
MVLSACGRDDMADRCESNADCSGERMCISGQCLDPGDIDAGEPDVGPDAFADACSVACEPYEEVQGCACAPRSCEAATECDGFGCVDGVCGLCKNDGECAEGSFCAEDGSCVEGTLCDDDTDCSASNVAKMESATTGQAACSTVIAATKRVA